MILLYIFVVFLYLLFAAHDNWLETFLAELPALTSVLLHVGHDIHLVDDLETEDRLNHILEGDDTLQATLLVDHNTNLRFLLEHGIEDIADIHLLVEIEE